MGKIDKPLLQTQTRAGYKITPPYQIMIFSTLLAFGALLFTLFLHNYIYFSFEIDDLNNKVAVMGFALICLGSTTVKAFYSKWNGSSRNKDKLILRFFIDYV